MSLRTSSERSSFKTQRWKPWPSLSKGIVSCASSSVMQLHFSLSHFLGLNYWKSMPNMPECFHKLSSKVSLYAHVHKHSLFILWIRSICVLMFNALMYFDSSSMPVPLRFSILSHYNFIWKNVFLLLLSSGQRFSMCRCCKLLQVVILLKSLYRITRGGFYHCNFIFKIWCAVFHINHLLSVII